MEIDFLGLNSTKYSMGQEGCKNVFAVAANGEVETSLSLRTSSSLDSHREILNFSEKKKTWEFPTRDKMIPSCSGSTLCGLSPYSQENSLRTEQPSLLLVAPPVFHHSAAAGFPYDLNGAASTNSRNLPELPAEPTTPLTMLYHGCPNVFNTRPEKVKGTMYVAGNASTSLPRDGYTPTVAMARRATLARFLEKRLHRMNQGRTSHLMGKSLNASNPEACGTSITKSNKKRDNNLKRRS